MEDKLETRWTHEDALQAYNPYREIFREASSIVVRDVFGQYVRPSDKIIEIGSGLGELVNLAPEYRGQVQQTEQSQRIAEVNRTLNPDSNVKVANVYALPFEDGEFSIATGCSVFDTLTNLEDALKEVGRVLTPDGKFIHFLDIRACENTFLHRYANSYYVPFPLFEMLEEDGLMHSLGFQLVHKKDLSDLYSKAVPDLVPILQYHTKNPEEFISLGMNHPQYRRVLRMFSDLVKSSGVPTKILVSNEQFREDLDIALQKTRYSIIESQNREGITIVTRNGRHTEHPDKNYFHNQVGLGFFTHSPDLEKEIGKDKIKTKSDVFVVVASCR